jgi:hypothetical protein
MPYCTLKGPPQVPVLNSTILFECDVVKTYGSLLTFRSSVNPSVLKVRELAKKEATE